MQIDAVNPFYKQEKPNIVIDTAAKVDGIQANSSYPAEFLYDNLTIQNNLINGSVPGWSAKICILGFILHLS